jgi:hypothetical protein
VTVAACANAPAKRRLTAAECKRDLIDFMVVMGILWMRPGWVGKGRAKTTAGTSRFLSLVSGAGEDDRFRGGWESKHLSAAPDA